MKIIYKQVKTFQSHCGECGEMLLGNGSEFSPYKCSCGKWEMIWEDSIPTFEYRLTPPKIIHTWLNWNSCENEDISHWVIHRWVTHIFSCRYAGSRKAKRVPNTAHAQASRGLRGRLSAGGATLSGSSASSPKQFNIKKTYGSKNHLRLRKNTADHHHPSVVRPRVGSEGPARCLPALDRTLTRRYTQAVAVRGSLPWCVGRSYLDPPRNRSPRQRMTLGSEFLSIMRRRADEAE